METATKVCWKCGQGRPLEEFDKRAKNADGHTGVCKACRRAYSRERRQDPALRERMRSQARQWYAAHADARREYDRKKRRQYRQDPQKRERLNASHRRWKQANPEEAAESERRWRAANPERVQEYSRGSWRKRCAKKPEVCKEEARRKLLRRHDLTPEQYDALLAAQGGVCAACGQPNGKNLAIDHDHRHNPHHRPGQASCAECRRGLLCENCNRAAGMLADSPEGAYALGDYLLAHQRPELAKGGEAPAVIAGGV